MAEGRKTYYMTDRKCPKCSAERPRYSGLQQRTVIMTCVACGHRWDEQVCSGLRLSTDGGKGEAAG